MMIDHSIPELDRQGLRKFGLMTGAVFVAIFGLFFPWLIEVGSPRWPWFVAAALWLPAIVYPPVLRPVYGGWMRFGLLASKLMTPLVLGIVFFGMISPMALIRRLTGNDPMQRAFDPEKISYRVESSKSPKEKLERPF